MKKVLYTAIFSAIATSQLQAPLVTGDPSAAAGETFSFDVGFASYDSGSDQSAPRLWVANNDPLMNTYSNTVKHYGLSYIFQLTSYVAPGFTSSAIPMVNEEDATIYSFNGTTVVTTKVPNPLWGGTFALFDVSVQKPTFVFTGSRNVVYAVQNIERPQPQTPKSNNVTQLLEYDFGAGEQVHAILPLGNEIFLSHSVGTFGVDATSKITNLTRSSLVLSSITDASGKEISQITAPYLKNTADTILDVNTTALSGNTNNIQTLGASTTFNFAFNVLYLGLDVRASAIANSCGTALVAINVVADTAPNTHKINYTQLAPTSVMNNGINTVISATTNNRVRITNIAGLSTSTGLSYLIVAQDAGTGPQNIYALPIVGTGNDTGKIADFTSIKNNYGSITSRQFDMLISDASQINPAGAFATQLQIGASIPPLSPGNSIKQLYAVGDSVYVVIDGAYATTVQKPGTFQSQAIFATDGHIIAWTPWTRVLGSDSPMNYSFIDGRTLTSFYIDHVTTNFRAVYETTFTSSSNLAPLLQTAGNIQGLFDFPQSTPGFNAQLSLMAATGFDSISIGQTGFFNAGSFMVKPMTPADVVSYSSTNLNNQHALIAAELAYQAPLNHWLFVGGASGVSVLTFDGSGITWSGNLSGVSVLNSGQTWKKIGDFSFVKKLVWDKTNYLYILTSDNLYRIALDANKFTATPTVDLNPELVLQASSLSNLPNYFLDIIIDEGFCVIGTTNGMYSLDLSTSFPAQRITIPDGLPAVSRIIAIAPNLQPSKNFATLSNLYVLNNTFGTQQARINRFVINNKLITDFNDCLVPLKTNINQGMPSSFVKFDNYISNYYTDGTWNIASSYFLGINQPIGSIVTPLVQQLFANIRAGMSSSRLIMTMLSNYPNLPFTTGSTNLAGCVKESTSGSLVMFGNFPAHVNA